MVDERFVLRDEAAVQCLAKELAGHRIEERSTGVADSFQENAVFCEHPTDSSNRPEETRLDLDEWPAR